MTIACEVCSNSFAGDGWYKLITGKYGMYIVFMCHTCHSDMIGNDFIYSRCFADFKDTTQ